MPLGLTRCQNNLRRHTAQNLLLQLQVKPRVQLLDPLAQQRRQPRIIIGTRRLDADVALIIHHIGGDGVQLPTHLLNIGYVERNGSAGCARVDHLGDRFGFGGLEVGLGFIQVGLAGFGNGAVDLACLLYTSPSPRDS